MKADTSEQMTDEEINVAIAEACGWRQSLAGWWHHPDSRCEAYPPDYTADLDAIHEAEETWIATGTSPYAKSEMEFALESELRRVIAADGPAYMRAGFRATARQRAEAFLRTVGKWRE